MNKDFQSKNILVTGGAGYIGSHTVVELINAGYSPVIVDNLSNSQESVIDRLCNLTKSTIPFYKEDFQNNVVMNQIITKHQIMAIIHFAAYKAVGESVHQPLKYYSNNVAGFISLMKIVEKNNIKHVVFSSSCTVYGQPDKLPVTEDSPIKHATSPYGATKQMSETILQDSTLISNSLNSISLRYFNPIGAHPSSLIGELPIGTPNNLVPYITQAVSGKRSPLTIYGNNYPTPDGSCIRDYIHVVDLASAHVSALNWLEKQPLKVYQTINIGTGKGSSVFEVIKTFETINNIKVPFKIGPRREGDLISTYASVEKAKKLLNWQSQYSLSDALKDAWNYELSNLSKK